MIWDRPIRIADRQIKNRIVFPPFSTNWANEDGTSNIRLLDFYRSISQGGCGMIVVSGTAVSPLGKGSDRSICLYHNKHAESLAAIAQIIKENRCFSAIQLMHAGGQGNPEFIYDIPVSPSGLKCKATGFRSRALNTGEIDSIRDNFITAASLAFQAGFEAVELHLAHGYLLHQFLSEYSNKREDEYGGTIQKRMKLILQIIAGIKQECPESIIGVRVSGDDYLEEGINQDVNHEILPVLQEAGVEYFSVTAGIYDTSHLKHQAMAQGKFFDYSREIKEIVEKPVIGVGKILNLEMAEKQLMRGNCDLVAIGRGLVADPDMVNKTRADLPINECTECGECQYLRHGRTEMSCPVREENYAG